MAMYIPRGAHHEDKPRHPVYRLDKAHFELTMKLLTLFETPRPKYVSKLSERKIHDLTPGKKRALINSLCSSFRTDELIELLVDLLESYEEIILDLPIKEKED